MHMIEQYELKFDDTRKEIKWTTNAQNTEEDAFEGYTEENDPLTGTQRDE